MKEKEIKKRIEPLKIRRIKKRLGTDCPVGGGEFSEGDRGEDQNHTTAA